ncbi:palmitoyltransferase for Vac8p [Aspergillus alliaceus]|nr:palmitoyltransferase for Vac8p [Aspergillus burnettii]
MDTILPVNVVLLAILGGIIGLVLSGFTIWHVSLAVRNLTTIESLEKTRYVSPLRKALDRRRYQNILGNRNGHENEDPESLGHRLQDYGNQIIDAHANAIPGVTRPEEGEESTPHTQPGSEGPHRTPAQQALSRSYADLERQREHDRYQSYLDEEDNEKMPNAFDLGWRRNLKHLFGDRPLLWAIPVHTTSGDGWHWEPSPKFLEAREKVRLRKELEASEEQQYYRDLYQRNMNNSRNWLGTDATPSIWVPNQPSDVYHETDRPATGVSMKTLAPMSPRPRPGDSDFEDVEETHDLLQGRHNHLSPSQNVGRSTKRHQESDEWRDWD